MFCDQRVLHFAALCFHLALLLWRILSNLVSDNMVVLGVTCYFPDLFTFFSPSVSEMAQEGPENSHQGHESPLAHAAEVLLAPDQEQCAWR